MRGGWGAELGLSVSWGPSSELVLAAPSSTVRVSTRDEDDVERESASQLERAPRILVMTGLEPGVRVARAIIHVGREPLAPRALLGERIEVDAPPGQVVDVAWLCRSWGGLEHQAVYHGDIPAAATGPVSLQRASASVRVQADTGAALASLSSLSVAIVPCVADLARDEGSRSASGLEAVPVAGGLMADGLVRGAGAIVGGAYDGRWWSRKFVIEADDTTVQWPPRAEDGWRKW